MNIAKAITIIGLAGMSVALVYAFLEGNFSAEGVWFLFHPWGQLSLLDVYIGFILFSGWVVFREKEVVRSLVWIILILVLGNWATSLYALLALNASGGDWMRFWMGKRAE